MVANVEGSLGGQLGLMGSKPLEVLTHLGLDGGLTTFPPELGVSSPLKLRALRCAVSSDSLGFLPPTQGRGSRSTAFVVPKYYWCTRGGPSLKDRLYCESCTVFEKDSQDSESQDLLRDLKQVAFLSVGPDQVISIFPSEVQTSLFSYRGWGMRKESCLVILGCFLFISPLGIIHCDEEGTGALS